MLSGLIQIISKPLQQQKDIVYLKKLKLFRTWCWEFRCLKLIGGFIVKETSIVTSRQQEKVT